MKLIRFGKKGKELPGVELESGKRIDVSSFCKHYNEDFFRDKGVERLKSWIKENANLCPVVSQDVRLGAPLSRPSKIICVGLNYIAHAKETGADIPKEPILFFKATSAIVGPNDPLVIPKNSSKTDWEVELAVVIGKETSYVSEMNAMSHVCGYVLHNDYSERAFQIERNGQWVKGKSCDSFAPLGPYLVTADEIKDPHNLNLWLKVNGEIKQESSTSDFIFKIPTLISYISQFMTLLPGDIISTGTPSGVGLGLNPQQFINEGDVVELGIDQLGSSQQQAVISIVE